MSDPTAASPTPPAITNDERILPGVVYALYLIGLSHGLTILVGVIMAYICRDKAGPVARSHYDFLIGTFWKSIPLLLVTAVAFTVGLVLSIVLIGIPILMGSLFLFGAIWVWFLVRCVIGAVHLVRGEAYPRPDTWLA